MPARRSDYRQLCLGLS